MGANTNGVPYNVQTNMPLGKVQFSSARLESVRRCRMHILNIGKRRRILKNHMLLQDTEKSTTLFLHGQFCTMLIEHDKLQDEDEDDDVEADFPEYSMYQE